MVKQKIEELEEISNKHRLRDPLVLFNIIRKLNELIKWINGHKDKGKTSESVGPSTKP